MTDHGKHVCQHLADLSGKSVQNIRMGKLAKMYSGAIKSRKEAEAAKEKEDRFNMPQVEYLKKLVAQEIEKCAEETDSSLPLISVFDALQIVKAHRERELDLGLRALNGHLETAWKKNREAVITAGSYLTLKDYYTRQYPKSKVASVFDTFQDEGYMDLPVGELMGIVAQIETQADYDYLIRDYGLDGNKPWQRKARQFIVAALNGEDIEKEDYGMDVADWVLERNKWVGEGGDVEEFHKKSPPPKRSRKGQTSPFEDDEYEFTPDEEDAFIVTGRGGLSISIGGKYLNTVTEWDEAEALIEEWMEENQFYPNVWAVSDHGNYELVTDFGKKGQTSPFEDEEVDYRLSPENEAFLQQILQEKDEMPEQIYGVEDFDWEENKEEGCDRKKGQVEGSKALEWGRDHMPYADFEKTGDVEYTITVGGKRIGYLDDVSDIGRWYGPSGQESEFWGVYANYEAALKERPELAGEGTLSEEDVYGKTATEVYGTDMGPDCPECGSEIWKYKAEADPEDEEYYGRAVSIVEPICASCGYRDKSFEMYADEDELNIQDIVVKHLYQNQDQSSKRGQLDLDWDIGPGDEDPEDYDEEVWLEFLDQNPEVARKALQKGEETGWGDIESARYVAEEYLGITDLKPNSTAWKELSNAFTIYRTRGKEAQYMGEPDVDDYDVRDFVLDLLEEGTISTKDEALEAVADVFFDDKDERMVVTTSGSKTGPFGWVYRGIDMAFFGRE